MRVARQATGLDRQRGTARLQKLESYLTSSPAPFQDRRPFRASRPWRVSPDGRMLACAGRRRSVPFKPEAGPAYGKTTPTGEVTGRRSFNGAPTSVVAREGTASAGRPLQPDGPAPTVAGRPGLVKLVQEARTRRGKASRQRMGYRPTASTRVSRDNYDNRADGEGPGDQALACSE